MKKAKLGDTVSIHFVGKLQNGTIVDSSAIGIGEQDPLQFTIGENTVKKNIEIKVLGMKPGETRTVRIPASRVFGQYDDDLVSEVDSDVLPEDANPKEGQRFHIALEDNHPAFVTVLDVDDSQVTVDANPPLAGEDLTYEIKLVEIM